MTNPKLRKEACQEADEGEPVPTASPTTLAETVGDPHRATAKYNRFRQPTLSRARNKVSTKVPEEQAASTAVQDRNPRAMAINGEDFYRAACVEAHRLLNLP
jgi:hypothetical protein